MNKQKGFTLPELLIVLAVILGFVGWIWNLVKVVQMFSCALTTELVLRIISVPVWPLGIIMGYIPVVSQCG